MQIDLSELESEEDEDVPGGEQENENDQNEETGENEDLKPTPIEDPQDIADIVLDEGIPPSQPWEIPDSMMEVPDSQVCRYDEECEDGHISDKDALPPPTSPAHASPAPPILISDSPSHHEEKGETETEETKDKAVKRMIESRESIDDKISELTQKLQNAKKTTRCPDLRCLNFAFSFLVRYLKEEFWKTSESC